jgi:hypothetical protein
MGPVATTDIDEAQSVGVRACDHWLRMTGEAPISRDNLGWLESMCIPGITRIRPNDKQIKNKHLGLTGSTTLCINN